MILSRAFLGKAGLFDGDAVDVHLRTVDPDVVHVPKALADALASAPELAAFWDGLTPDARRGFVSLVASAKRSESRAKRVDEVLAALESDRPSPYRAGR